MPFTNRIRLPFEITKPQFPEEKSVYRKANGEIKTLSVVVRKTYEGATDYFPERWHERLKMALAHDNVTIEGEKYLGGVTQEGDYNIEWVDFLGYPTAPAKFKIQVTPFEAINSNCQTCDTALQLSLVDDYFNDMYGDPIPLQEGDSYTIDAKDNDSIRCYPAVFSITTYNSTFLTAASIDQDGIISITIGTGLQAQNGVALVTYRVTCPDGSYDEAVVYGDIDGSIVTCLAPTNISGNADSDSIPLIWDAPSPAPGVGYNWQIENNAFPGVIVDSGFTATTGVTINGLLPNTHYVFSVQGDCGASQSPYVIAGFTTAPPPASGACGVYDVNWSDGTGINSHSSNITYLNCNSDYITIVVFNEVGRPVCALQNSPGDPISITGATSIFYVGTC